jgi:4-hydroxy-tetrahydrodipicolinate synthase
MQQRDWRGVFPAITTPFTDTMAVDHARLAKHVVWLVEQGCVGIVALGSLGEAATLTTDEKISILETCRNALGDHTPVIGGIAGLATSECVALAKRAEAVGCDGLMVLPPYVYKGDWRETKAHFEAVISATPLSCMLYNNPIAYGTDVSPAQMRELAEHANLHAMKESSGDVRRVTAVREELGDRLAIFAGMDDMIVESIPMGVVGWVAGLVNALPAESVKVFEDARDGRFDEARTLYEWFLPLLRLDTVPKFVQLIKLVQTAVGQGSAVVRPPRLELAGAELEQTMALIRERLANRPATSMEPLSAARLVRRHSPKNPARRRTSGFTRPCGKCRTAA